MATGSTTGVARVISNEIDLTSVVTGTSGVEAGIIVKSARGNIKNPTLSISKTKFLNTYTANGSIPVGADLALFSAMNFLTEGSRLRSLRVVGRGALYAGALTGATVVLESQIEGGETQTSSVRTHAGLPVGIEDPDDYIFAEDDTSEMLIYARDIETFGNRLSYAIRANADPLLRDLYVYLDGRQIEGPIAFSRDESYKDGMSQATFCEITFKRSAYVGCISNRAIDDAQLPELTRENEPVALSGGTDGASITDGDYLTALDRFYRIEETPLTLFLDGGNTSVNYHQGIATLCSTRQDCLGILSVPYSVGASATTWLQDAIAYRNSTKIDTSYCALYFPFIRGYDKWNDRDIWMPPDGFVGSKFASAGEVYEYWYPVGGTKRGVLLGAKDTQVHLEKEEMSELVDNQINPIQFTSTRIMIMGQETMQVRKTHLSDIHVRMALVGMRPQIKKALEDYNFDFNDVETRLLVTSMCDSRLQELVSRNAFEDAYSKCDADNNTAEDLDNNRFNVWIFVKPKGYNKYIYFTTILTPNSMTFDDAINIVGGNA